MGAHVRDLLNTEANALSLFSHQVFLKKGGGGGWLASLQYMHLKGQCSRWNI